MLDIRFIQKNLQLVEKKAKQKGYDFKVKKFGELYTKQLTLIPDREMLRKKRNELAEKNKMGKPSQEDIKEGKKLKEELAKIEDELKKNSLELAEIIWSVPNIFPDDTPLGGEEANEQVGEGWGDTTDKDFEVKDHVSWAEEKDLLDFERGAKVAGNKFYYTKGVLAELELAILQLGLELAKKHGFTLMLVPHLVNTRILEGTGFSAKGEERQIYKVENEDLNLIATAEIPLTGYHTDEILSSDDLPKLYAGFSPSYRVEAGAYGKHAKGLYRVHQFDKLELYVFCKGELRESEKWHQKMVALEKEFCQMLEIPYRVVRIASQDLGATAYKKFDVEYWTPVGKTYRELMSCSNVTDYQARRLNIRYKNGVGETQHVHTLNGTLAAMSRIPIAIIENHQNADSSVKLPKALQPYMHGQKII